MRVKCQNCQIEFRVDDRKIPENQVVRIKCPKCSYPIEICLPGMSKYFFLSKGISGISGPLEDDLEANITNNDGNLASEFFEESKKIALACVSDLERLKNVNSALESLEIRTITVDSVKAGLRRLHHDRYDVVVLDEAFCSENLVNNTILRYLQPMPMQQRRRIFTTLLSPRVKSCDNLSAFILSVNMVVNYNDLDKLDILIRSALKESNRFYKIFNDSLRELEKH